MRCLYRDVVAILAQSVVIVLIVSTSASAQVAADNEPRDDNSPVGGARVEIDTEVVQQLDNLIREQHVRPFWLRSEKDYAAIVRQAKARVAQNDLAREQRLVELLKVLAAVGDGHSGMAGDSRGQQLGYLPVTAEWFGDELRIVRTASEYQGALGARIVAIEGTDLEEVTAQLKTVVPHANHQRFLKLSPSYLQLPGLLSGLGITSSPERASFTLKLLAGNQQDVMFRRMSDEQYEQATFVTVDESAESLPLYRQRKDDPYWYDYRPQEKLFYLKYNRTTSDETKPIWTWAPAMWAKVDSLEVDKFVIDIRDNGGGGFQYSLPVIQGILDRPHLNRRGKFFVFTGYKTFSAAIGMLEQLENRSQAIIIGQPPCDHPASPGDDDSFSLGSTGIQINLSQIYHATIFPADGRESIGLDKQIETTWADYVAGRDPLLTFVKGFQSPLAIATPPSARQWMGRYFFSPDKALTISQTGPQLTMEIGKFFTTPLYPDAKQKNRFSTEVVELYVDLSDQDQVRLRFPDGKARSYARSADERLTPLELVYAGKFDEALKAYRKLLENDPHGELVSDGQLSETALLAYWDLVKLRGREKAKECARNVLEIALKLFPDDAPLSQFSLRFYQ